MLGEVFYWIFNMSIVASLPICLILLLRRCRLIKSRWIAFLWGIPMVRFVLFVGLQSRYSFMTLLNRLAERQLVRPVYLTTVQPANPAELADRVSAMNIIQGAVSYAPIRFKVNVLEDVFAAAGIVWCIVMLAILLCFGILYCVTMRELRDSKRVCANVYTSQRIDTPSVYGILRPRIIIPEAMAREDHTYILLHEREHIRRGDNLWRVIGFVIAAIHWFNPFAWIFLNCYLKDLELACDEGVLRTCTEQQRKEYAMTLLRCAETKNVFVSAFGGSCIRVRIKRILSYREVSLASAIVFMIFATVVICTLLTNAV